MSWGGIDGQIYDAFCGGVLNQSFLFGKIPVS